MRGERLHTPLLIKRKQAVVSTCNNLVQRQQPCSQLFEQLKTSCSFINLVRTCYNNIVERTMPNNIVQTTLIMHVSSTMLALVRTCCNNYCSLSIVNNVVGTTLLTIATRTTLFSPVNNIVQALFIEQCCNNLMSFYACTRLKTHRLTHAVDRLFCPDLDNLLHRFAAHLEQRCQQHSSTLFEQYC